MFKYFWMKSFITKPNLIRFFANQIPWKDLMSYYAWCWATVFFCHIFVHKGKSRNPKTKKAFKKVWFSVQTMNSVAKLPPVVELMRRFSWFQNEIFFQGREFSGVSLSAARSCFPRWECQGMLMHHQIFTALTQIPAAQEEVLCSIGICSSSKEWKRPLLIILSWAIRRASYSSCSPEQKLRVRS